MRKLKHKWRFQELDLPQLRFAGSVLKGPKAEENRRRRVVHGWSFSELTESEAEAVKLYLRTGEMNENFPDNYRKLHEVVS